MERYSLEKAQNEAEDIRKKALESKKLRGEVSEPTREDYTDAETNFIRPEFIADIEKANSFIDNHIDEFSEKRQLTGKIRELFSGIRSVIKKGTFSKCESSAENLKLLDWILELENKGLQLDGDNSFTPYNVLAEMLYKDNMSKSDIQNLIDQRKKLAYVNGLLNSGGGEALGFPEADNDEIINYGKSILSEIYKDNFTRNEMEFETWKSHTSYLIWAPLAVYLKLDDLSINEIVELGLKHNESWLWNELIVKREKSTDDLKKLSSDEIQDIISKIASAYAPLIGMESSEISGPYLLRVGGPMGHLVRWMMDCGKNKQES
ncbi:MAG: hypothetical protein WC682_04805 [Parcubacteria group bacterium]|jgi:hypothetical protein